MIDPVTIDKMCAAKTRYSNPEKAGRAAQKAKAERGAQLRVYPCPLCGGYHLTKKLDGTPPEHSVSTADQPDMRFKSEYSVEEYRGYELAMYCADGHRWVAVISQGDTKLTMIENGRRKDTIAEAKQYIECRINPDNEPRINLKAGFRGPKVVMK
jgi:hypothetical protein